jgi:hypothetical protein
MGWISVEDRLPTDDRKVLIWWSRAEDDENFRPVPGVAFGRYIHCLKEWRPVGCNGNFNDQVTHWMPPPEPPKEDKP